MNFEIKCDLNLDQLKNKGIGNKVDPNNPSNKLVEAVQKMEVSKTKSLVITKDIAKDAKRASSIISYAKTKLKDQKSTIVLATRIIKDAEGKYVQTRVFRTY